MDMQFRTDSRSREDLIDMLTQEAKRINDKLKELQLQIGQTQMMVDREQQRNNEVFTELRIIQDNIETVPRQDIRQKYDEALELRHRLTTMRTQLEKFTGTREMLEQEQALLREALNRLQGIDALPVASAGGEEDAAAARGGLNIVRIIQAQEDERQRLARQMHDGPAQSLTNFILQAEICQKLFDRNPARAAEELSNLKEVANTTFQRVRDFIFDLRPMMLDDLGVIPTVRRYVEGFKDKNDIQVKFEFFGDEQRRLKQNHREVLIFRSIQELMTLARDFAQPNEVRIRLDLEGLTGKIIVEDDGRGFDAEAAFAQDGQEEARQDARVQALITLREKFELVGGSAAITSGDKGTIVRLELPIED